MKAFCEGEKDTASMGWTVETGEIGTITNEDVPTARGRGEINHIGRDCEKKKPTFTNPF